MSLETSSELKTKRKLKIKTKSPSVLTYADEFYPKLEDPLFSMKLSNKNEFRENGYIDYVEGTTTNNAFKEKSEMLCNLPFSLAPHQRFVKNFMSFNTPYNSLLLYHGLGTGKTCSAMGICEEMRDYMGNVGLKNKIIIIASPNVQENFKNQLFNKHKLKKIAGSWNIESCVGNILISEITQNAGENFKKEKLIRNVERLIKKYYMFMGYQEFSNFFNKKILQSINTIELDVEQRDNIIKKRIQSIFQNRLIVVDEAHNLRPSNKKEKGIGNVLTRIAKETTTMRLLLLSATPMYNSPQEIIWLLNLMLLNSNLPTLHTNEVFDKKGNLLKQLDDDGNLVEMGAIKLSQKMSGHISFVRGDNPFTFPFSLYPSEFSREQSVKSLLQYPEKMLNGKDIVKPLEYLDCYMTTAGKRQQVVYKAILAELKRGIIGDDSSKLEDMEGFGYNFIQPLLDCLIIGYPSVDGDVKSSDIDDVKTSFLKYTGRSGLEHVMDFTKKGSYNTDYSYKNTTIDKVGRLFSKSKIGAYSGKIYSILEQLYNTEGIVMVYSQFLEGSLIPLAIALEEEGYRRSKASTANNMLSDNELKNTNVVKTASYAFISGNVGYSPNNAKEMAKIVSDDNKHGDKIKIVLISRAGSEGLDFKNIRQLHILEPWYNTKRIEQIIGRGVRNCSHKTLPFEKRNVAIYLHATNPFNDNVEPVDLYVYRYAESGAVKMGVVSRIAKETSIDCLVNNHMMDFDSKTLNITINILLSNGTQLKYKVGDKPYSSVCDYMKKCSYVCKKGNYDDYSKKEFKKLDTINGSQQTDINPSYYESDVSHLISKIGQLYLENYVFSLDDIHRRLKGYAGKPYSIHQVIASLNAMSSNQNIKVIDNFGRYGSIVKVGDLFFFNPSETLEIPNDVFEIKTPIEYKHQRLVVPQSKRMKRTAKNKLAKGVVDDSKVEANDISTFLQLIADKIDIAFRKPQKINNDKDWYRLCSFVIPQLMTIDNMSVEVIQRCIIEHIIDFDMDFVNKRDILELFYGNKTGLDDLTKTLPSPQKKYLNIVKRYLEEACVIRHTDDKQRRLFGLFDNEFVFNYYILVDGVLVIATPEDKNDFKEIITNNKEVVVGSLAEYVGFVSVFKQNRIMFKVKHMKQKRSKGARCDQAGKSNSIALIKKFRDDTIDGVANMNTAIRTIDKLVTNSVCVYQEVLLRYYNAIRHTELTWFLPLEQYKQIDVEKITMLA